MNDRRLRRLVHLAYNLRWTWEPRAAAVFAALAPEIWDSSHNPVAVLQEVERSGAGLLDEHAVAIDEAAADLERYLHDPRAAATSSTIPHEHLSGCHTVLPR